MALDSRYRPRRHWPRVVGCFWAFVISMYQIPRPVCQSQQCPPSSLRGAPAIVRLCSIPPPSLILTAHHRISKKNTYIIIPASPCCIIFIHSDTTTEHRRLQFQADPSTQHQSHSVLVSGVPPVHTTLVHPLPQPRHTYLLYLPTLTPSRPTVTPCQLVTQQLHPIILPW
jgi:hypothetical protein